MPILAYDNFDLLIVRSDSGYLAIVIRSPVGQATTAFSAPFSPTEVEHFRRRSLGYGRHLGPLPEGEDDAPALDTHTFGRRLYQTACAGEVNTSLLRSLDRARSQGRGLRIRLWCEGVPELADLPWEYLYVPDLDRFLALSDETPLVRYRGVREPVQALPLPPPLTILTVVSNPSDALPLAVEVEWQRLVTALAPLRDRKGIFLERLEAATWDALQTRLRQQDPVHILHFIGHGTFDRDQNIGRLLFENGAGRSDPVADDQLATLLHDHDKLRLLFLNACEGAAGGRNNDYAGVALQMVQRGIPAVLAMQFPVSDSAAIVLSQHFYDALAEGLPAEAALTAARKAISKAGHKDEWGTPTLFSRAEDNRLIEPPRGDRRAAIEIQPFEPETVLIPAGTFSMGRPPGPDIEESETPLHNVWLPDYRLGRYPVTARQYAVFLQDQKDQAKPQDWFNREPPAERLHHPVTHVSWHDALAYCVWLSARTGRRYTLPSEAEWEKAAAGPERGDDVAGSGPVESAGVISPRYPWGDDWGEDRCNSAGEDTTAVDAHPTGASRYGVEDLLGNVQEWTRSLWGARPDQPDYSYPYEPAEDREISDPDKLPAQARLVHRGGSFKSAAVDLRCSARGHSLPDSKIAWRGFRVAIHFEEPAR